MIPAEFHPEAQIEMQKAAEYYESQQSDDYPLDFTHPPRALLRVSDSHGIAM